MGGGGGHSQEMHGGVDCPALSWEAVGVGAGCAAVLAPLLRVCLDSR